MPRPLFGFRQKNGHIIPCAIELAVVKAVLAAPRGRKMVAARMHVRESPKAVARRLERIQSHLPQYLTGSVVMGVPADPLLAELVLA